MVGCGGRGKGEGGMRIGERGDRGTIEEERAGLVDGNGGARSVRCRESE